ncbi:MAG TPA: tetratricopeptide repeat protein [Candidatus Binatia bacterium]|nr:tetratricopeptide repeat protein [Candidatus Binatia bacterium]
MAVLPSFVLFLLLVIPAFAKEPITFEEISEQAARAVAQDRSNDAIRLFRAGLKLHPGWAEGWWSLGTLFYDQDRFSDAAAAFRRFLPLTPKRGPAYAFLALCEYETRDLDQSLRHFRAWASSGWPGTRETIDVAVFHFALLLTREGKFVEALYLLTPEVVKMGNTPALTEAMGLASLRMRNLPEDCPPERREMVWLAGQAAAYAEHFPPDYARADEYADRLLVHYDTQPEVHFFRGTLFNFEKKNSAEAEREFRKELGISPDHVPAMLELAAIDLGDDNLEEASTLAKRAIQVDPQNAEAHHIMGRVWLAKDQPEPAAAELETAKRLAPTSSNVRSHLAIAYGKLGRVQEAKAEAALAISLKKKEDVPTTPQEKLKLATEPEQR